MTTKPSFIIITGPTGIGKTDFALELAKRLPSEIINADMGQCYKPLTVGTSKPDWKNQETPHHLFDIADSPKNLSVTEYRKKALGVMNEIWTRNKTPIVVGGSGFYIKSLMFPPQEGVESVDYRGPQENLWDQLHAIDPERASSIHKNDTYRLKRALTIWHQTGVKPSSFAQRFNPPGPFICIFVSRDKSDLHQRINDRVIKMLDEGWLDEVKSLQNSEWEDFLKLKKIIGYELLLDHLHNSNEYPLSNVIMDIQKRTRNYAKRQITFLKMLQKKIEQITDSSQVATQTFNLNNDDYETAISSLIARLK